MERHLSCLRFRRSIAINARFTALGALFIALIVAMAGCAPSRQGQAALGGAPQSAPVTVHLAYFPNVTHAVAIVGAANGSFTKALGPTVKIDEQIFTAGPAEIEALFANGVDIGYIGPGPAINGFLKSHKQQVRIIAGACYGGVSLVVRADSGIDSISKLAGKRVAVPQTGGTQDISLRHALQSAGLQSTDHGGNVTVLPVAPADTLTLFVRKQLDAAWVAEPWVSRLVKEGGGRILSDERDLWPGKRFATTVVIVRPQFMKEHPEVVDRFLDAHVQTIDWIGAHRKEAQDILGERLKKLTGKALAPDVLGSSFDRAELTWDPVQSSILSFADWSKSLGYLHEGREGLSGLFDIAPLNGALSRAGKPALP